MQKFSNNGSTVLAVGISEADTAIELPTGHGALFPVLTGDDYFLATIEDADGVFEIVKVVETAGDQLTVERAHEDAVAHPAVAFSAGSRIELRTTAGTMDRFIQRDGDTIDGGVF